MVRRERGRRPLHAMVPPRLIIAVRRRRFTRLGRGTHPSLPSRRGQSCLARADGVSPRFPASTDTAERSRSWLTGRLRVGGSLEIREHDRKRVPTVLDLTNMASLLGNGLHLSQRSRVVAKSAIAVPSQEL